MFQEGTSFRGGESATMKTKLQAALLHQQPPLADWLEALSHDGPFERGRDPSIWDQAAPRLALVPILISLLNSDF
jgi:hypothetical protein